MRLEALTLPTNTEALTLYPVAQAKRDLRIDHSDEDTRIEEIILDAVAMFEGPFAWLGRPLLTQSWRIHFPAWPIDAELSLSPLRSVLAIRYRDTAGDWQTMADATVSPEVTSRVFEIIPGENPTLKLANGQSLPSLGTYAEPVQIDVSAGYGAATDVPRAIRRAIGLTVGTLFDAPMTQPPPIALETVTDYRLWRFG